MTGAGCPFGHPVTITALQYKLRALYSALHKRMGRMSTFEFGGDGRTWQGWRVGSLPSQVRKARNNIIQATHHLRLMFRWRWRCVIGCLRTVVPPPALAGALLWRRPLKQVQVVPAPWHDHFTQYQLSICVLTLLRLCGMRAGKSPCHPCFKATTVYHPYYYLCLKLKLLPMVSCIAHVCRFLEWSQSLSAPYVH